MNNKLSKFAAAALSALVCVSMLTGCNKDGNEKEDGSSAPPTASESSGEAPAAGSPVTADFINADWTYGQVAVGGGGFVSGVFSTPEKGVYYARTDVGGAYYRTPETGKWTSMNCWVSSDDRGLLGVDGLAFDPQSPNRVFLLLGTEYFSNGKTVIAISDDYGKNLRLVDVTDKIKVHGNGMGRGNGERIAVDPNNGNIIFAGGRSGGMIKSTDGGASWESVTSFPVSSTANANGINCILFDPSSSKDGAAQRIYASVSEKDGLYASEDGGATWNKLESGFPDYMVTRMKLDAEGNLYVCCADSEGPWNCKEGLIYRRGTDGSTEIISPTSDPYGDILIDPNDSNKLIAVTSNVYRMQPNGSYGDNFYTSEDGGQNWKNVLDSMEMSVGEMPWVEGCAIHWCSCLALDPFDSNKIMVNSGNGVFSCDNIWDETPKFYFDALGIEETVPLDIITLKDYPLVSSAGDYDGFVHEDISIPATRHRDMIGTTTSITIAPKNRDLWAKAGGSEGGMALTCSTDAGKTWNKITASPEAGKTYYGGCLAFNADGSVLTWCPENSLKVFWTDDLGKTWNKSEGIVGGKTYLIGDPNNAELVYGCSKGAFYVSSDGGKSFEKNTAVSPSFRRVCPDPENEGTVYIPNGAGLFVSRDSGKTTELVNGIKYCEAVGLGKAKNDGDPLVIYIWGTPTDSETVGIYMSEDNGASWSRVNDDLHIFGGPGNGEFISGDMNVYGRCYMSTVGMGIAYFDKNEK